MSDGARDHEIAPTVARERSHVRPVVLEVGPSRVQPERGRHQRLRDEVQCWVADTREDPPVIRQVPELDARSDEAQEWRDGLKFNDFVCPWPRCPDPRLLLRAGEVRSTHVAHRTVSAAHGARTDWVLHTIARIQQIAGAPPLAIAAEPPTVHVDDVVLVLLHGGLGQDLERSVFRVLGALPKDTTPVAVLRSSSLPLRSKPVLVKGEERPRWAFSTTRQRTVSAIKALEQFAHVLGAPERPAEPGDENVPDPRWNDDWIGLGLERLPDRGRLDWRGLPRSPLVAVRIDDRTLHRIIRPKGT